MSLHPSQPALSKKPVEDFSQAVLSLFPGLNPSSASLAISAGGTCELIS